MNQFNPNWPVPVETTREHPTRDKVNLSNLPPEKKRKAFERMQELEPGMAEFVKQFSGTFDRPELYVDQATARRLGVGE